MQLTKQELKTIFLALRDHYLLLTKEKQGAIASDKAPIRRAMDETLKLSEKVQEEIREGEDFTIEIKKES